MTRPERSGYRIDTKLLFGKYRIISTLGAGSSGTVYLAEHLKLKVYRAIKCIPKDTARNTSNFSEEQLLKEAGLLKNLNHPGIPLIYDIDEDDHFFYMIEEFIQGDSLEDLILHQEIIPEEQFINYGMQICAVLDYLHHLSPYPILYQDLKPEHIILCGDQVKLLDFGIASFFTGFGKNFQLYGTSRYCAPEILRGQPVTPAADIYSLGRVLTELSDAMSCRCSRQLRCILEQACAADPADRCQEACDLKAALLRVPLSENQQSSHLIRNIAVIGSRPGAGATHISISLVSTMNQKHIPAIYAAADGSASLLHAARANHRLIDQNGIFIYGSFRGIPDYGDSISVSVPPDDCVVRDYGTRAPALAELASFDLILFVLNGGDWDFVQAAAYGKQLALLPQTRFLCNHGCRSAAKAYARQLGHRVYCFPEDAVPYDTTPEKERLVSSILPKKGGRRHLLF